MQTTFSQIGQDIFVINVLKQKKNGIFLDIGGGEPVKINNTYLLEKNYNWSGISIDNEKEYKVLWDNSNRNSDNFLIHDALTIDYDSLISDILIKNKTDRIDYLSMDLEPPQITLEVLLKFPLDKCRFSVITFEHDLYRNNSHILETSRELFKKYNYKLIGDNINNQEDWWIDSTYDFN
jgi:hypothetical protein